MKRRAFASGGTIEVNPDPAIRIVYNAIPANIAWPIRNDREE